MRSHGFPRFLLIGLVGLLPGGCPVGLPSLDGDSDPSTSNTLGNTAPVAHAGDDQIVLSGDTVFLNGVQTSDPDADALLFSWQQLDGEPEVELTGRFSARPRFTAPSVASQQVLTFRLTVSDGVAAASADTHITILP